MSKVQLDNSTCAWSRKLKFRDFGTLEVYKLGNWAPYIYFISIYGTVYHNTVEWSNAYGARFPNL